MNTKELDKLFESLSFPGGIPPKRMMTADPKPVLKDPSWDDKPIKKMFNGVETEFFTIGALAEALNRKTVTIRSWEDKGIIPYSRYRTPAPKNHPVPGKTPMGRRLYTRQQIEVVIDAAKKTGVFEGRRGADWRKFTQLIVDGWNTLR